MTAFEAAHSATSAMAQHDGGNQENALSKIADGKSSVNVVARIRITQKGATKSLDDLPPEIRAEVEKAIASGKTGKIVLSQAVKGSKTASGSFAGANGQTSRCEKCGCEFSSDLPSCPQCGTEKKRSFWSRLFSS